MTSATNRLFTGSVGSCACRVSMDNAIAIDRMRVARNTSLPGERRERVIEHLVGTQLRREDALHHQAFNQSMKDAHEMLGFHRELTRLERAQPFGSELVAALRDLVHA